MKKSDYYKYTIEQFLNLSEEEKLYNDIIFLKSKKLPTFLMQKGVPPYIHIRHSSLTNVAYIFGVSKKFIYSLKITTNVTPNESTSISDMADIYLTVEGAETFILRSYTIVVPRLQNSSIKERIFALLKESTKNKSIQVQE